MDNIPLFSFPENLETRWASPENPKAERGRGGMRGGGRKGSACFAIAPGERVTLAEESGGSGTVRRIWSTLSDREPEMLRGLWLEFYWDGATEPAVSAPFGDFFGIGLGRNAAFQSALFTRPEGRSFNCYIPMPFKNGMRITVTNKSPKKLEAFYYDVDYTLGDAHGADVLYLHALYRRENPTVMQRDYEILPRVRGRGRFLGANVGVVAADERYHKAWWGEGEVKIYLDEDGEYPTLCGTGTEDYIGTGYGQGRFDHLYQGCPVADEEAMAYCFYRYHIPDPVYFCTAIRVTIQQIGCWNPWVRPLFSYEGTVLYSTEMKPIDFSRDSGIGPYGLFERSDDWSSCAYFYLDRPGGALRESQ